MAEEFITLENGLRVLIKPAPLHSVALAVGVGYGSLYEFNHPETSGSSHFFEHMLFKGTSKRTWGQQNEQVRTHGIYRNADTYYERIVYFTVSSRRSFDVAASILSDMLKNSTLPPEELKKERGAIINEIRGYYDDVDSILEDHTMSVLFANRPPSLPVAGTIKSVKNITRERLMEIYKASHTPDNAVVVAYGDIIDKKRALKSISDYFGDFTGRASVKKIDFDIPKPRVKESILERDWLSQTYAKINFLIPPRKHINAYGRYTSTALSCFSYMLDYRLFDEVREKRGLVYSIQSMPFTQSNFGVFSIDFGSRADEADLVRELSIRELEKVRNGEVSKSELSRSKRYLQWLINNGLDEAEKSAEGIAEHGVIYNTVPNLDSLRSIKLEDIIDAADRYLNPKDSVYTAVVPKQKK